MPAQENNKLPPATQEQALAALIAQASRARPTAALLDSYPNGVADVTTTTNTNSHPLLCPRSGCGSLILLANAAKLVRKESLQLEPSAGPLLPPLPPPPAPIFCWLVTPSPMAFENIGFTRLVPSTSIDQPTKPIKLLVCAECELGPLGWCEEGGSEFWLACSRVGYKL